MSNEKQQSGMVVCGRNSHPHWQDSHGYCTPPCPASPSLVEGERQELLGKEGAGRGDIEPHLRTEEEVRDLFPRFEALSDRLCQTQGMILWALKEAGLTVVRLDPSAREVAPDASPTSEPRAAPPISLEEQAQPDAQDLTEEEIATIELHMRVGQCPCPIIHDGLPRLLANEKRRRGIK